MSHSKKLSIFGHKHQGFPGGWTQARIKHVIYDNGTALINLFKLQWSILENIYPIIFLYNQPFPVMPGETFSKTLFPFNQIHYKDPENHITVS